VHSTIDLVKAFWQSRIFPPHASRVALRIAGQNYFLKKLFFGIRFGSSTFQQLLQDIVGADLFQEHGVSNTYCRGIESVYRAKERAV
jgi:hypothetical protein